MLWRVRHLGRAKPLKITSRLRIGSYAISYSYPNKVYRPLDGQIFCGRALPAGCWRFSRLSRPPREVSKRCLQSIGRDHETDRGGCPPKLGLVASHSRGVDFQDFSPGSQGSATAPTKSYGKGMQGPQTPH